MLSERTVASEKEGSLWCEPTHWGTEKKRGEKEDELNETQKPFAMDLNEITVCAYLQALKFSLAAWLKTIKKPTQVISLIWLPFFVWNFLTVTRLFLFLFCAAPCEMLPWIYIFTGLLLVIDTHCKLELTWMMSTYSSFCLWGIHSYVSDIAYSSSRFYT